MYLSATLTPPVGSRKWKPLYKQMNYTIGKNTAVITYDFIAEVEIPNLKCACMVMSMHGNVI